MKLEKVDTFVVAIPASDPSHTVSGQSSAESAETPPLSLQLRAQTAELHRQVERRMGLPQAIASLAQYRACLDRFHSFYQPYEELLSRFPDWPQWEIHLGNRAHAPDLALDLDALASELGSKLASEPGALKSHPAAAPATALPALPSFAYALGALYVSEGSTLGSQFILRHLAEVLGPRIAGADRFFRSYGPATGERWSQMRTALDRFGRRHPEQTPAAIEGATRTFQAIGEWMVP